MLRGPEIAWMMRGIAQCYECFGAIAEARFAIRHKKTRRFSAPGALWAIQDWLRPSAFQGEQHNAPAIAGRCRFFMPLS